MSEELCCKDQYLGGFIMNNFKNTVAKGFSFKKIFTIYFIASLIAGIVIAALTGFIAKDKIAFFFDYQKATRKISQSEARSEQKDLATDFAAAYDDVVDVLILDKNNTITFSAKNSAIAKAGALNLESVNDTEKIDDGGSKWSQLKNQTNNVYLTDPTQPGIYYKVKERGSFGTRNTFGSGYGNYGDRKFYESANKTVYSLSYVLNRNTGEKTYFILSPSPMVYSSAYIIGTASITALLVLAYFVLVALYVYQDAKKSKQNATIWGIFTLFTNLWGLVIYFLYKRFRPALQ
jgi:hypothetical protein